MSLSWNTNNYNYNWQGVASNSDGTKLIAGAYGNGIWQSLNSGTTWSQIYTSGSNTWFSVTISGDGTVLAAVNRNTPSYPGTPAVVYVSTNSGATWTARNISPTPVSNQPMQWVSCNSLSGQYMVAAFNGGSLVYSTNTGSTWSLASTSSNNFMATAVNAAGDTMYGVNLSNQVWKSTNYGSTWNLASSVTGSTASGTTTIACSSNGAVVVVPGANGVFLSTDGATTWTNITPAGVSNLPWTSLVGLSSDGLSIFIGNSNTGGSGTYTYLSTNGGVSWTAQTSLGTPNTAGWNNVASNSDGSKLVAMSSNTTMSSYIYTNVYICFKEGSTILCLVDGKETYLPVQDIRKGVLVKTSASGYLPVTMIGSTQIFNPDNDLRYNNRLFRLSKENYPELTEDLVLTGGHAILVDSLTDKQREDSIKENGDIMITENKYRLQTSHDERAIPYEESGLFNIWHFSLENAEYGWNYGVYANGGLLVETASEVVMKERSGLVLLE